MDKKLDPQATIAQHLKAMTPDEWRAQLIEDHLNCYMCGSPLKFVHVTHFAEHAVDEEAHCMFCQIRIKKDAHILQ